MIPVMFPGIPDEPQIMTVLERRGRIQDDVDLDKELIASVVGTQVLNLADSGGEAHGKIEHCGTNISSRSAR